MKFNPIIFVCLLCHLLNPLVAQVQKNVYQTIDISDSTKQINFNFSDTYEIVLWNHESKIMFETVVSLELNNSELLNLFIKEGRYNIVEDSNTVVKTIKSAIQRPIIKNPQGKIYNETVAIRIYVPEDFLMKKSIAYKKEKEILVAEK